MVHTQEETIGKTKSQSPSCEHFFFLMQKLACPISLELKEQNAQIPYSQVEGCLGYSLGLVAEKGHIHITENQIQVEPERKDL